LDVLEEMNGNGGRGGKTAGGGSAAAAALAAAALEFINCPLVGGLIKNISPPQFYKS